MLNCLAFFVQFLVERHLPALSSLANLRELSLRGAASIKGTGLARLSGLSHLQVKVYIA